MTSPSPSRGGSERWNYTFNNTLSYIYVLLNDFFTAGNGIIIKQKLETKEVGKYGLMAYNCLFMLPPTLAIFLVTEDVFHIIGSFKSELVNDSCFCRI